jgi:type IV pilus assembly protein PilY1
MNTFKRFFSPVLKTLGLACGLMLSAQIMAVTIPNQPLSIQPSAKPMIMLAFGRDHRLYYEAYNDASDIDGDGVIDIRFKPNVTYLGLFDSNICYTHSGAEDDEAITTGLFTPSSAASGALKKCVSKWSGNWLNYVTTSRIDALRVVLYGGMRDVDSSTQTILRRAYIPRDAHSWAKEYTSPAIDKYLISDYTPLAEPTATDRRHFFGSLTRNASINCDPLANCSSLAPWLSVITNSPKRVWEWASTERPVLSGNADGTRKNYTVRVEVCTASFNTGCKLYPNGNYKPIGILHDFGENDSALFGMFSGSYDSHLSGGRLRKVISSFSNEIVTATGVFDASITGIVTNFNNFRIFGFNRGNTNQIYDGNVVGDRPINQGEFPDWGNPVAELMYEATRYFANKGAPTAEYIGSNTVDDLMGLSRPDWDRPYSGQGTSTASAPWCARATLLTISDTNINFDSDQLPGVNSNFGSGISTDLTGKHINTGVSTSLNVKAVADFISANEPDVAGLKFIGQNNSTINTAPASTNINSLGNIRGLAPEEPTKRGSYYSASVAHYAKVNDLNSGLQGNQTVDNFFVALASPLLRIEAKLPNGKTIALLPFAKSVGGAFNISPAKANYQPTNQIVDFYVETIANSGPADADPLVNGGRYEAKFRINYEDVEQGNDHDMDAIVVYTVRANANNTLDVTVEPIYEAGGVKHRMGYVISGSTQDGVYLVVQDESDEQSYYLNVPPGRSPGYCDQATPPADCTRLPFLGANAGTVPNTAISTFNFSASTAPAATFLKDPMWYAAKWGGFTDINNDGKPDIKQEWDFDNDGSPDTYFFVQNPTKLRESLTKAFKSIVERQGSSSNLAANVSGRLQTDALIYRASYIAGKWKGDIEAIPVTATGLGAAPSWRAQDKLPVWSDRKLFMHSISGTGISTLTDLRSTSFSGLRAIERTALGNVDNYNYIRGDFSKQISNGGNLRNRDTPLADIIHSSPAYDADTSRLYLGSNGGMLHAFDGKTGVEQFGIIPRQVVSRLKNLANIGYASNHEYFVDGDVMLGLKLPESNNTKYLYTLLGRGGKGLFSINPGVSTTLPTLLWEYTPAGSTTAASDADLGLMTSRPLYAKLNNGKMGVIVGNGYNSASGKAVLYIFMINPNGSLFGVKKIDTLIGGDNGLAGASFYDSNGDKVADAIYAGDYKGNLWKFDISDANPANWKLAFASGDPLFKATDSAGKPQPITAPVYSVYNSSGTSGNVGEVFVYFGTGSYIQTGDNNNVDVQTWYGIIDDVSDSVSVAITSTTPARSNLVERILTAPYTNASTGDKLRDVSTAAINDMNGKRGFYIDFKNPIEGERITNRSEVLRSAIKPTLIVTSIYPINNDICIPGGGSWFNAVDPFTGAALDEEFFLRNDKSASLQLDVGIATTPINLTTGGGGGGFVCVGLACLCNDGNACKCTAGEPGCNQLDCNGNIISAISGSTGISATNLAGCKDDSRIRGRISWREILKD